MDKLRKLLGYNRKGFKMGLINKVEDLVGHVGTLREIENTLNVTSKEAVAHVSIKGTSHHIYANITVNLNNKEYILDTLKLNPYIVGRNTIQKYYINGVKNV